MEKSNEELAQYRRDRRSWADRRTRLDVEREREPAAVTARYAGLQPHRFPVAVVFVVPRREATDEDAGLESCSDVRRRSQARPAPHTPRGACGARR
ncbi:MAG: hypothetical protein ACRDRH_15590 [Pseudonocardia sp.]